MNVLWRRLDRPGHDAAFLRQQRDGWRLTGAAVFLHGSGPACVAYDVETDASWIARNGRITGFIGDRPIDNEIRRESDGWSLNGAAVTGLAHLEDLDLSFTPATNLLQLRRASPKVGETISLPAAWFDLDNVTLAELPQVYERIGETTYKYIAATIPYEATLEVSADGFIADYPGLWTREA
ncbi:MAG: putative glycolipid-binding domain-containing protein [Hyphomicrobiales bacterium]|nr:putative glycolipid-binding domain-containing protein [Hyphomicrobiales bacterium]